MSIEWLTFRTLLVALDLHDADATSQDRGEFGISKLLDVAIVRAAVLDRLHGFALQAISDLLERPAGLVLES